MSLLCSTASMSLSKRSMSCLCCDGLLIRSIFQKDDESSECSREPFDVGLLPAILHVDKPSQDQSCITSESRRHESNSESDNDEESKRVQGHRFLAFRLVRFFFLGDLVRQPGLRDNRVSPPSGSFLETFFLAFLIPGFMPFICSPAAIKHS